MLQVLCPDSRAFSCAAQARFSDFALPLIVLGAAESHEPHGASWRDLPPSRRSDPSAILQEDHPRQLPLSRNTERKTSDGPDRHGGGLCSIDQGSKQRPPLKKLTDSRGSYSSCTLSDFETDQQTCANPATLGRNSVGCGALGACDTGQYRERCCRARSPDPPVLRKTIVAGNLQGRENPVPIFVSDF
jgi:hypothetical protein